MQNLEVDRPLYNSRIIDTYIRLIKRDYPHIKVNDVLRSAGMETYQVKDESHWFTQRQINRFHEKLQQLTGNKDIAVEAGRYAASPEALGVMRKYLIGLIRPYKVYENVTATISSFTKSSEYTSRKINNNTVEIIATPNHGVREESFQCRNRFGWLEALLKIFGFKLNEIHHPECLFKGGKRCRYIVTWQKSNAVLVKRIRNYAILVLPVIVVLSHFFLQIPQILTEVLPVAALIILLLSWFAGVLDVKELWATFDNMKHSSHELVEQINMNYENALMINEIGQTLSKASDVDGLLLNVVEILKKHLDYDRGLVLLATPNKTRLVFRAGFGYNENELALLTKTGFSLDKADSKGIFIVSFKDKKPFLLNDIEEIKETLSPRSQQFAKLLRVKSFICCPIMYENESLGILAVDNVKTKRPLIQRDINLLMGVAPQIGISIHNATLMNTKLRQFQSILKVLAATIDARDPITAGHSERVTEYALGICHELGFDNDFCEVIRVASLLHDYGKIGVKDSILKKPGRLTPEERLEVMKHVEKSREILERIHFEGIYAAVPEIAGAHHEKLDGSGYPRGLNGDEIPYGAKIIAVADVFEAITSKRHYRDPMPLKVAFAALRMDIGIHFDKDCVEALIRYVKNKLGQQGEIGHEEIFAYQSEMGSAPLIGLHPSVAEELPVEMAAGREN
jgi:HD-GYP domain-containing protein (c-di-GMP phosphodiesterase class II)